MPDIETFQPDKRTLGELLSNTSPPIRVPDFQRDFSWEEEQVSELWSDLTSFSKNQSVKQLEGKEYFLGAAVMVNSGSFHLLLDGQQRLATATILLAALRDKIIEYDKDAAKQIQDRYIAFEDKLTGEQDFKIQLNLFDRDFFRDRIQRFPAIDSTIATKKSHKLITEAYDYFQAMVSAGWDGVGGGQKGFEWAANTTVTLCKHMALVTVVSNNEKTAASIFATLNDRGIGLSTVDLIRSFVLQRAHDTEREEILKCWDSMLEACGTTIGAETLIRLSWISQRGDIKARALYKDVSNLLEEGIKPIDYSRRLRDDAVQYRKFRDGDTDDLELQDYWLALHTLNANSGYALLLAAHHKLDVENQKALAKAVVALAIRHNVVCDLDRAKFESALYSSANAISADKGFGDALATLRAISPAQKRFNENFETLRFSASQNPVVRYILREFEMKLQPTEEVIVAGPGKVHIEHIYPQNPPAEERWLQHDEYINRVGNLTLLDHKLNTTIKNSKFSVKKEQAYKTSKLEIASDLLQYEAQDWSPQLIDARQKALCLEAEKLWPEVLIG